MQKRTYLPVIIGILVLVPVFLTWYYTKNPLSTRLLLGEHTIYADIAISDSEKQRGLGKRDSLPLDRGMLFVFNHKEPYTFWMKDMKFPLDFIWIDGNIVADLTENVPVMTDGKTTTVRSSVPVDKILELNAGSIRRFGISIGDPVVIRN
jgi:hypothetical protein